MICLLLGPPGCGKGTQARMLSRWLGVPSLSTGALLRESGDQALQRHLAAGGFATDDMVNGIIRERLESGPPRLILDGYPRTLDQAVYFDNLLGALRLPPPVAIHLRVSLVSLEARLVYRRECRSCRRVYNLRIDPPATPDRCDDCTGSLAHRDDDGDEIVRRRLTIYQRVTAPVVDHYKAGGELFDCDGDQHPTDVFAQLQAALRTIGL